MLNLFHAELFKWKKDKSFWVTLIVATSLAFLLVLLQFLDDQGYFGSIEEITIDIEESHTEEMSLSGVKMFVEAIYSHDLFFRILMISILGAFFITRENVYGTVKNLVSTGESRRKIYFVKWFVFTIGGVILAFIIQFSLGIFGTIFFGLGDLPNRGLTIELLKVILLTIIYILAFSSITFLFSIIAQSNGISLLLSLGTYFLLGPGLSVLALRYQIFEQVKKVSVYQKFTKFFAEELAFTQMIEYMLVPFVTFIIVTIFGLILFQRKDIS